MMKAFQRWHGATALVKDNDVYTIRDIFAREGRLYAPHNKGFVLIGAKAGNEWLASPKGMSILEIDCPGMTSDKLGRPIITTEEASE